MDVAAVLLLAAVNLACLCISGNLVRGESKSLDHLMSQFLGCRLAPARFPAVCVAGFWRKVFLCRLQEQLFPERWETFSVHLRERPLLQNPTVLLEGPAG